MNENKRIKMICFDMDGTLADFYGVDGWLEMLDHRDTTPYKVAKPLWDMDEMFTLLNLLKNEGIEVRVITWTSRNADSEYHQRIKDVKREWLDSFNFPYDHFHCIRYGKTKADSIRRYLAENESAILVDDNEKICKGWHMGETVKPQDTNLIDYLTKMVLESF